MLNVFWMRYSIASSSAAHGARCLQLERLPGDEVFGRGEHFPEQGRQPFPALPVVFGAVSQDAFGRFGKRAVVLARYVFVGLEVRPQFPAQALVVAQPDQDVAALGGAFEDRTCPCRRVRSRRPEA